MPVASFENLAALNRRLSLTRISVRLKDSDRAVRAPRDNVNGADARPQLRMAEAAAQTAAQRFFSTNPRPAQIALVHAAFDASIETLLFLRGVNRTFRELATDAMLAQFRHAKISPHNKSRGIQPPKLVGGEHIWLQQTMCCFQDCLYLKNEWCA